MPAGLLLLPVSEQKQSRYDSTAWQRNRSGVPGPSWLIDGTLVVPDDAATDIGHAVGGRAGLDQ